VVVIDEGGVSWQYIAPGGKAKLNPCLDKILPATRQAKEDGTIVIHISGSAVIDGCGNQIVTLKRVDTRTLDGKLEDGRAVHLAR
jgi:hypothetical protein